MLRGLRARVHEVLAAQQAQANQDGDLQGHRAGKSTATCKAEVSDASCTKQCACASGLQAFECSAATKVHRHIAQQVMVAKGM